MSEIISLLFYLVIIVPVCWVIGGLLTWMERRHLAYKRKKFIADLGEKIWTSHK
jgi:hypothetical protein